MTSLDRREFIVGLAAITGLISLEGCRGQDLAAVRGELQVVFGQDEAWKVLGDDYLSSVGLDVEKVVERLAKRLDWRPSQGPETLVGRVVASIREDFESGVLMGPDGWSLSETELQIYAVVGSFVETDEASEAQ